MNRWLQGLSHVLAPRVCRICGQSLTNTEDVMCLGCLAQLPRACIHDFHFNIIHQRLGHKAIVHQAAGWFMYRKQSPYARLLIDAKYAALPRLACKLGQMCAAELAPSGFFADIDAIAPMPMHWLKRWQRGYNQACEICQGISQATGLPVLDCLQAVRAHGVQARHSRQQRFSSIDHTMQLAAKADVAGKRILLVDDIITTGASMAEAVRAIHAGNPAAVSVLCLGLTAYAN